MTEEVLFAAVTGTVNSTPIGWNGGRGAFVVSVIGGGTITLKAAGAAGVYISLGADVVLTAPGIVNFDLPPGFTLRADLAAGVGVTASVVRP